MAAPPQNRNPSRRKNQPRRAEFDAKHSGARQFLKPQWQLVGIPANPRRQRLGLVMKSERGKIAPVRVTAEQLHAAGRKHELEQQQPQQPERNPRWRCLTRSAGILPARSRAMLPCKPRQPLPGREENGEKSGFEQQVVPLKTQKVAPDRHEREIQQPQQSEARRRVQCRPSKGRRAPRPQRIGNQESHPKHRTSTASATGETGPGRCLAGRIAAAPPP